jgi:two-component system, response regulator YesN
MQNGGEKLKLLIVEDENKTRTALVQCIPWSSMGFSSVEVAVNGYNALNLVSVYRPDIVITDIRMPEMDGLELAKRLLELDCNISIIIISAYAEIDYFKSAIKCNVVDYLLKPVQIPELEGAVNKAISRYKGNISRKKLDDILHKSIHLLREEFFNSLLDGNTREDTEISEKINSLQLNIVEGLKYNIAVMKTHNLYVGESGLGPTQIKQNLFKDITCVIKSFAKCFSFSYVLYRKDGEFVLVAGFNSSGMESFETCGSLLKQSIEENCRISISLWMGKTVDSLGCICRCYDSLRPVEEKETANSGGSLSLTQDSKILKLIRGFVEENYHKEELSVNKIAESLFYTSAYICMVFKQATGITLNDYINSVRIQKAKKLLKNFDIKLIDIALAVGYSNDNYFSKVFKKYEGITPTEYRKSGQRYETR